MNTTLQSLVDQADSKIRAGNLAREYIQARILESLQSIGGMIPLAFQGGTALRFLYDLPRFSEDLDSHWNDRRMVSRSVSSLKRSSGSLKKKITRLS